MDKALLDIYTDYLIRSFAQTTATGLSTLLSGTISHDRITRFLAKEDFTSADLWQLVKPLARKIQSDAAVLIVDDSIQAKPDTDESALICWHWDHTVGRSVKGINRLSALYYSQGMSLPVAFELIKKTLWTTDKKTGKRKRACPLTKNDYFRQMLQTCLENRLPFRYVLADLWFASAENMVFVKKTHGKDFIFPLKDNRKVALCRAAQERGAFVPVSSLELEVNTVLEVWLEDVDFPLLLCKPVFTNKDGSPGVVYLLSSDTTLSAQEIATLYQKRWKVEEYHKSVKSNACFSKSPTKTLRTPSNHLFACLWAYVKLERLRVQTRMNHFALKANLYQAALASAFQQLQTLRANCAPA
jgi:IS4 transposase